MELWAYKRLGKTGVRVVCSVILSTRGRCLAVVCQQDSHNVTNTGENRIETCSVSTSRIVQYCITSLDIHGEVLSKPYVISEAETDSKTGMSRRDYLWVPMKWSFGTRYPFVKRVS